MLNIHLHAVTAPRVESAIEPWFLPTTMGLLFFGLIALGGLHTYKNSYVVELYGKQRTALVLQHDLVHKQVVKFGMTEPLSKIYNEDSVVMTLENPVSVRSAKPRTATDEERRVWGRFFD